MKLKIIIGILSVFLIAALIYFVADKNDAKAGILDSFAKCLSEKGAVMYGAAWCAHCQNEKKAFGSSFKYINYVECPADPQKCIAAGIEGYPTWTFPDGRKLLGEQGVEKLSQESSCPVNLPTDSQ